MNESPTELPVLTEPGPVPLAADTLRQVHQPSHQTPFSATLRRPSSIALITLALLLLAQAWSSNSQMRDLREDVARRLQKSELSNLETSALAKAVQETGLQLQFKVSALENRQIEAQSQQLALEQLYRDLSKNRDEWALTEIEQVLSTASAQLQLAGNVAGALIALQNADRSLSRSDKPQFITIRRAIAKDSEKLKALPSVDSTGVALHLDAAVAQIDTLPMLADARLALNETPARPARLAPGPLPATAGSGLASRSIAALQDIWHGWSSEMWLNVRQLIRVRNVETPDALMLSPSQAYFLRENLKLRLLNVRLALLSRNETAFRSDLIAAQSALAKYFDTSARQTQATQALLRQVQESNLAIDMPTLAESINAVRSYKAKP